MRVLTSFPLFPETISMWLTYVAISSWAVLGLFSVFVLKPTDLRIQQRSPGIHCKFCLISRRLSAFCGQSASTYTQFLADEIRYHLSALQQCRIVLVYDYSHKKSTNAKKRDLFDSFPSALSSGCVKRQNEANNHCTYYAGICYVCLLGLWCQLYSFSFTFWTHLFLFISAHRSWPSLTFAEFKKKKKKERNGRNICVRRRTVKLLSLHMFFSAFAWNFLSNHFYCVYPRIHSHRISAECWYFGSLFSFLPCYCSKPLSLLR